MDVVIFVRDLDGGIPPIEIDEDLDATYNRPYCGKTTLQDSDLRINQYLEVFLVADTRLYNLPCRSVRPSVRPSVRS